MGKRYLLDTNIVFFYLENKLTVRVNTIIENAVPNISVITRMELLSWRSATKSQVGVINEFIKASFVYNLDEDIILKAIDIRKSKNMKLPDAIIAATAMVNDLILVTNDASSFNSLTALRRNIVRKVVL